MATDWRLRNSFDYQGQTVACDAFGAGDPVVLIHGTPFPRKTRSGLLTALDSSDCAPPAYSAGVTRLRETT